MPYPPQKTETYVCSGGINQKVSQYVTPDTEFLALQNVDFRTMGALSSFAGSTQFSLVGSTTSITGIAAYFASLGIGNSPQVIATDTVNVCDVTGRTFMILMRSLSILTNYDQRSLVLAGGTNGIGALYGCGAGDFWTYRGSTASAWQFSLPKPWTYYANGFTGNGGAVAGGFSGLITFYFSLYRKDGFIGPARAVTYGPFGGATLISINAPNGPYLGIGLTGGPPPAPFVPSNVSLGSFGLDATFFCGIKMWVQPGNGTIVEYTGLLPVNTGESQLFFTLSVSDFSAGVIGLQGLFITPGSTIGYVEPKDYQGSFRYGLGVTQGGVASVAIDPSDLGRNPQCIEYHYDRLFSAIGSRVIYSNPGTPEEADYENFFFVAQNQPLDITTMKSYFTQLLLWKFDSTWSLSGTSPDTFVLTQSTPIYGCISKNGACVWEQKCWFLDAKGICEFNGANTAIVSNKVESYFKLMNVQAAAKTAIMVHVKERNEVWCAIPISGSEKNNLLVVYDYLSNAWTTRTIANDDLTFLASLTLGNTKPVIYNGTSAGMINYYGSSMVGDNGVGFTSIIKSRFVTQFGNSVEAMYRRLYLDVSVPPGTTQSFLINLYADKGASPYYSVTMSVSGFQNRIDFGVPARSMAVEFIYSTNSFMQLNGFTIESRFQRNV